MKKKPFDISGRLTDWEIIEQLQITKLPVNPMNLAAKMNISVITYWDAVWEQRTSLPKFCDKYGSDGFTMHRDGKYTVFYNHTVESKGRRRWTLMHELAHILRGHVTEKTPILSRGHTDDSREDIEANNLTRRVLCPTGVLYLCNVQSVEEIKQLCGLSTEAATYAYEHYLEVKGKNKFFYYPQERSAIESLMPFIEAYNRKGKKPFTPDIFRD